MKMIRTRSELLKYLDEIGYDRSNYRIAVEGLIFTKEGKLILEKRGPRARDEVGKLEGVGGKVEDEDEDLHARLQEEISEELGDSPKVSIDCLLEVRQVKFYDLVREEWLDWVVVSYLCRLIEGNPIISEAANIESLHELTIDELYSIDEAKLSRSAIAARKTYKAKYGNRPYYEIPEDEQ